MRTDRLRPWLLGGMCALFVARPLFPSETATYLGDGLPVVMLWIVLTVVWLLGAIGHPQLRLRFGCTDAAVVLLIGWHTVAALWAAKQLSPRPAVNMLWEWIALGLAFLLARQLIAGRREARAVIVVMIALAVALSGYGLYQYFYELPNTRAQYAADPDGMLRAQGLWYPPGSRERQLFESRLESTEPFATFELTNSLAGYLAPWLVMLVGIAAVATVGGDSSRRSNIRRTLVGDWSRLLQGRVVGAACAALPIAACLLLTKSRSGYVATGLGLILVWLLGRKKTRGLGWKLPAGIAAMATLLIAAAVATGGLDRQVLSEASKSLGYRIQYWQSTLQMIADHPLVGCGPGNFQNAYTAYKLPEASEEVADPHNFLMEVWATAGTPAMVALVGALGCFLWVSWRSRKYQGGPQSVWERAGVEEAEQRREPSRTSSSARQNPHPKPPPEEEETSTAPAFVFGGAVCGFLLAWPLGLISSAPPGLTAVLLGLPLAAGCVAVLAGWVVRGWLPAVLPAVGVLVLLVNLLAAGGIGFPGVAGSLWLLLALGLNAAEAERPPWTLPRVSVLTMLAVALAAAAACYATAYRPVLCCRGNIRSAQGEMADGKLSMAEMHLRAAAEADPWAAEPWQQLTSLALTRWQQEATPGAFRQFDQYLRRYDEVVEQLTGNSSRAWMAAGELHRTAYAITGRPSDIRKAIEAYSRAVELYPNSGLCRAKLALAHQSAGDVRAFRQEADRALRLDEQTPHADNRLPVELRRQLLPKKGSIRFGRRDAAGGPTAR
jgi:O-antigen ligase